MTRPWPRVCLAELLTPRNPDVVVDPREDYEFAGVYSFGRGAFRSGTRSGGAISYRRLTTLRAGDIVYPKLMAWEGAFAVVPPNLDGHVVSTEFPVFQPTASRLESAFLGYYLRSPSVWPDLTSASSGTNVRRRRLQPADFLAATVSLPPLDDQRRIVAHLDGLSDRADEVTVLLQEQAHDGQQLLLKEFLSITQDATRRPLGDIAPLVRRPEIVQTEQDYPGVSVRSFGRGTFHNPPVSGADLTWEKPHLVRAGDILVSNIKAWEGAIAVAQPEDDGRFGSHRYLTYVPKPGIATARFISFFLLSPEGLRLVGEVSPGSADRNRTTSARGLLRVPVPVPPYGDQVKFDHLYDRVLEVQQLRESATADLKQLVTTSIAATLCIQDV